VRMVLHRDDGGHEGCLGGAPAGDERVGEDDAFELVDGEEASGDVRAELAAVLTDLGAEGSAWAKLHLHDPADLGCGNPPLLEARGIGPSVPDREARRLDDAGDGQVELGACGCGHADVSLSSMAVT